MNFCEQPPSKQWAALTYKGESFAEVWFKPDDQPWVVTYRIPQKSFQVPGLRQLLTAENLLKAVSIAAEDIEYWRYGDSVHSSMNGANPELKQPFPLLPPASTYLNIEVTLKPTSQPVSPSENPRQGVHSTKWQVLETRWNAILVLEVAIDTMRLRMEALRGELESSVNKMLSGDEKLHAPNADVAQWNKAKSRGRYAVPKAKEFIHRATWAMGAPERKKMEEFFKNQNRDHLTASQLDEMQVELENLFKDRQILSAHGVTVYQECKNSATDIQGSFRTLQSNANKKRVAARAKGKPF